MLLGEPLCQVQGLAPGNCLFPLVCTETLSPREATASSEGDDGSQLYLWGRAGGGQADGVPLPWTGPGLLRERPFPALRSFLH